MKKQMLATVIGLVLFPLSATAYEAGDILVRAGVTTVAPDDGGDPDGVWAGNNSQIGINGVYMHTSNIGFEVLAATPFKHDIETANGNIGTTKHLPPTVSAQYYFNSSSVITPYVGAGLNYTVFFAEQVDGVGDIELKNSMGLALQIGADFAIDDHWGINLDVRKIQIETEVESPTALKGIEVEVNPLVTSVTGVYKF